MYLCIRNPGVADHRGFTLIGASTTRNSTRAGLIGQFGSGSKHAIALLLRNGIRPTVFAGNLQMDFFTKPEVMKGIEFNRIMLKYSGKDEEGRSKSSTEELNYTTEWGEKDWTNLFMGPRELVANAIDAATESGKDYRAVQMDVVAKPRAKAGYTSVYLPYTEDIEKAYRFMSVAFLHLGNPENLDKYLLPKRYPDKVLIYKKGVLVCRIDAKSVFDYNLGEELTLDESRNASEYAVKYAVAQSIRNHASPAELATIFRSARENENIWEAKLDSDYLKQNDWEDVTVRKERSERFQEAWKSLGEGVVACSGVGRIASFVERKGYQPAVLPNGLLKVLESYDVLSEGKVLSQNEMQGRTILDATEPQKATLQKVWALLERLELTSNKEAPKPKSFQSVMDGGTETLGYYSLAEPDTIFLHCSLEQDRMAFQTVLEEVVHYVTGAADGSRDLQDWLFRAMTELAHSNGVSLTTTLT